MISFTRPPRDFNLETVRVLVKGGHSVPNAWRPFVDGWYIFRGDEYPIESISVFNNIRYLNINKNENIDFSCLRSLSKIKYIAWLDTDFSEAKNIFVLQNLETILFDRNKICDISAVVGLKKLKWFQFSNNRVSSLEPIKSCTSLRRLSFYHNLISDLSPLSKLTRLRYLDCCNNPIRDISPALAIGRGIDIVAGALELSTLPRDLKLYKRIGSLNLTLSTCPGFDSALFNAESKLALIAHFSDLKRGLVNLSYSKALVLGNGKVGKTQMRRRLFGQNYEPTIPSTHGIQIETKQIKAGKAARHLSFSLWDFGGQDLYHGTHGLFIRSGGLFIVCWTPKLEQGVEHDPSGLEFPNRLLAYWLSWITATAGKDVAVICIQTQADSAVDARPLDPKAREILERFAFHRSFATSALVPRGLDELTDALNDAFDWQQEKTGGALTGAGRIAVMDKLNVWRQADQVLPADQRKHQTLTKAEFKALCYETGGVSDCEQLLIYLNAIGLVFYHEGLFENAIILDQAWALDAIYTIFTRGACAIPLKAMRGRFTSAVLSALAWTDKSEDEQALLLSMMRSCGIAFPLDTYRQSTPHTEWLAPALLPSRAEMATLIDRDWEVGGNVLSQILTYDFMHDGLIRTLMAEVGKQAGYAGTYWDTGFVVYDTKTRSRLMVEASREAGWNGILTLQTRGPAANDLLNSTLRLVEQAERLSGLTHGRERAISEIIPPRQIPRSSSVQELPDADDYGSDALEFGLEPRSGATWALSYAHRNAAHPDIEDPVDAIEAAAKAAGIYLLRDKNELNTGDRISVFARELAQAEKSVIVLSHKYLTAGEHCMQELFRIYRKLGSDSVRLANECKIYALPCAEIHDRNYRKQIAEHWAKIAKLGTDQPEFGRQIHDKAGTDPAWNPTAFANETASILAEIADSIRDVDLDTFLAKCF